MKFKIQNSKFKIKESGFDTKDLIKVLLINRGIKTKRGINEFLDPKLEDVTIESVGIDKKQLRKAINRIQKAIKSKEKIVVFGDYDVDGICGTAILWETLNSLGADVMPYIPHRIEEGYGLSSKGISNLKSQISNVKLIITVDNGIVANAAVEFANKQRIDVIIIDHHVPSKNLPEAFAIVHTTKLCGAGVAWMLSNVPKNETLKQVQGDNNRRVQHDSEKENHLELVALATIADLVPLVGANRTFVKLGLEKLRQTKRIGLLELFKEAGLEQLAIGVYEIGHIIAPRLNAMGRLEYAMDSLRLLCTKNRERAEMLAQILGRTNRERQELTLATFENSKFKIHPSADGSKLQLKSQKLLFIADSSYQQGVIGLVAGKLVEEFYKPAIVVSIGEKYSKASARSVTGFNIIEFIRGASELLVDAGGHPMAAGFTVETAKLTLLQKTLEDKALKLLDEDKLTRGLRIDCELPLSVVDSELYQEIQKLAPFGMGNPEPTFVSRGVMIGNMRLVGRDGKHVKLQFIIQNSEFRIQGIAFGMGERANEFHVGDKVDVVYTIDEDSWNGNERLQLKVKDIKQSYL
ncbi:MAG: single-stranded-DNA-specific exonuclease RecJ [Patescibacteria group bacterium]